MTIEQVPRLVCWFSCGAASAVATKLAIQQYQGYDIIIAEIQCGIFCEMAQKEYT